MSLVLCDLDGVAYDFVPAFCAYVQSKWRIPFYEAARYNLISCALEMIHADRKKEFVRDLEDWFRRPETYLHLKPLPGAQEAVRKLSERFDVYAFTSRPYEVGAVVSATKIAVARDFPWMRGVKFAGTDRKATAARELRARWVFEDNQRTAAAVAHRGVNTFLIGSVARGSRFLHCAPTLLDAVNRLNTKTPLQQKLADELDKRIEDAFCA